MRLLITLTTLIYCSSSIAAPDPAPYAWKASAVSALITPEKPT